MSNNTTIPASAAASFFNIHFDFTGPLRCRSQTLAQLPNESILQILEHVLIHLALVDEDPPDPVTSYRYVYEVLKLASLSRCLFTDVHRILTSHCAIGEKARQDKFRKIDARLRKLESELRRHDTIAAFRVREIDAEREMLQSQRVRLWCRVHKMRLALRMLERAYDRVILKGIPKQCPMDYSQYRVPDEVLAQRLPEVPVRVPACVRRREERMVWGLSLYVAVLGGVVYLAAAG